MEQRAAWQGDPCRQEDGRRAARRRTLFGHPVGLAKALGRLLSASPTRDPAETEIAHSQGQRGIGSQVCASDRTTRSGRRRYLKAAAEQDAWVHSLHEKCTIAVPLVIPTSAA
jgi:hypothetical protein